MLPPAPFEISYNNSKNYSLCSDSSFINFSLVSCPLPLGDPELTSRAASIGAPTPGPELTNRYPAQLCRHAHKHLPPQFHRSGHTSTAHCEVAGSYLLQRGKHSFGVSPEIKLMQKQGFSVSFTLCGFHRQQYSALSWSYRKSWIWRRWVRKNIVSRHVCVTIVRVYS